MTDATLGHPRRYGLARRTAALALIAAAVCAPAGVAFPAAAFSVPATAATDSWVWPLASFRVERPYEAPAHRYGPGHRGIDITAGPDTTIRAPESGVVAFVGLVVDRNLVTIDHGRGFVSTLEPVESDLSPGSVVERGSIVGQLSSGGHALPGRLHLGVRLDGEYINPLLLLGGVPRAVLLPCC